MKSIFDHAIDDNPYTHPMLIPASAFGAPVSHVKTDPVGGERQESERAGEKVVKEQRSSLLGVPVVSTYSTK
jgi:hypothetical protein